MANNCCGRCCSWLYALSAVSIPLLALLLGYTDAASLDTRVKNLVRKFLDVQQSQLDTIEDPSDAGIPDSVMQLHSISRLTYLNVAEDLYKLLSDDKESLYDAVKEQLTRCWRQTAYWKMYSREKCYTMNTEELSWYDARSRCAKRGGLLWTVEREELGILATANFFNNDTDFIADRNVGTWAGAIPNDFDNWIDGSPIKSDRWHKDFKLIADLRSWFRQEDLCMTVWKMPVLGIKWQQNYKDIKWFKFNCKEKMLSICQHDADPPLPESEPPLPESEPPELEPPKAVSEPIMKPKPRGKQVIVIAEVTRCSGRKISSPPSWSHRVRGVTACGRMCKQQKMCQLFNYHHGKRVCNGYNSEPVFTNTTVPEEGWRIWSLKSVTF